MQGAASPKEPEFLIICSPEYKDRIEGRAAADNGADAGAWLARLRLHHHFPETGNRNGRNNARPFAGRRSGQAFA